MCPRVKREGRWRLEAGGSRLEPTTLATSNEPRATSHPGPPGTIAGAGERGIALLIVVSVLTVIGIMGVAFAFSMRLEGQATTQFVAASQARYVAEAGMSFARALLDEDRVGSQTDDRTEPWTKENAGSDVDVDEDGTREARWRLVASEAGGPLGRFGVLIEDEASKGNVNVALAEPSPFALGAINLTTLLEAADVPEAKTVARTLEAHRYGVDQRPGVALVDDDRDGAVDELDEYQPLSPWGDDRVIERLEELVAIAQVDAHTLHEIERYVTPYSWTLNVASGGQARVNVNTATAEELLAVMLAAGVDDPWQAAVNLADYVDPDVELSHVSKASQRLTLSNVGPLGSWSWKELPAPHYETDQSGGSPLTWTVEVPTGSFQVLARGLNGIKVCDVTIQGITTPSVDHGQSLGTVELTGTLDVTVTDREPAGTPCAFTGLDFVSEALGSGMVIRGIEAVRINELMVEPSQAFPASAATFTNPQGSGWACDDQGCRNSTVGQASWTWASGLRPGAYHLWVWGAEAGQVVGEVCVGSACELLVHGQRHSHPITVGATGQFTISIGKTQQSGTYYMGHVELSLQPDGEYVELINLTNQPLDVSGWTMQGDATLGRIGRLPGGSTIAAHGLLVAAVDLDDEQLGLAGDGVCARTAWEFPVGVNAVQFEFPGSTLSADVDWLKVGLPNGTPARLALRSAVALVDEVEYPLPLPTTAAFQSLEKGDPTVVVDADGNGVDDGWTPSLQLYTPGITNENAQMTETTGDGELIVHDPAKEVTILNRPLGGIGEITGLPSGLAWKPFATADLAKIVDRLTVDGLRLETEGRLLEGDGAWTETAEGYEHSDPDQLEVAGIWQWTGIPDGRYRFSLYGRLAEQLAVRWQRADLSYTDWTPELTTDAQGRVVIGQLAIGLGDTPSGSLTLQVRCGSPSGVCHADHVRLDPRLVQVGGVNINTASEAVLRALPGVTETIAQRIMKGRPYGDLQQKGRGIGDLLLGDVLGSTEEDRLQIFRLMGHVVTTRSNVFRVLSLGEALDNGRSTATQRIVAVVQR